MPPSRTVAPYAPTRTPPASRRSLDHGRHPPPFIPVTNPLERTFVEVRRRTKVIGRFPGETSCLSLCWAVLDLVLAGARGLGLTDLERQQVLKLRAARGSPDPLATRIA